MEQYENCSKGKKSKFCCIDIILVIVSIIITFFLGVILESAFGILAFFTLGVIIAILIILALILLIRLISLFLCKSRC